MLRFLNGGGAMGRMLREHDWAGSALGPPAHWPPALRTIVGVILSANQPMFTVWGPERLLIYNDGYADILGGHHPALARPFAEVWREIWPQVGPMMARAYSGVPTYMDAIQLTLQRHGHDEEAHFSFCYTPLRDDDGEVCGVFCACDEITGQVHAARERAAEVLRLRELDRGLRESEEKFRTFAQAVPNHVWTSPPNGQLDWFNHQTLAYSGMDHDALAGDGWATLVHPDDLERAARAWTEALETGKDYEIDFRIRRADGQYRWHLVRALPIRGADAQVLRWVGTNTDIHDRRSDQEALLALNATLELRVAERTRERERIWVNAPDLMAVLGVDGVYGEVNTAWTRLLGWLPHEVVGKRIDEFVHPDDRPAAEAALARAALGVLPTFECRFGHADGSYRIVAWTAAPEGRSIFAFGRDITTEKEQKRALELAEEQLRQAQKMEAIGQLTGGIAHDFNNMLAAIYGSIQLMQRRLSTGNVKDFGALLDRAASSTQRATALTQRLLAFARRQSLDIRRVDVQKLVSSLEDMFGRTLGPRIELQTGFSPELWFARIDAGQLENALLNLVINARDAMPDGGRLMLEASNLEVDARSPEGRDGVTPGEYVVLSVSDNGTGMPASVIDKAFEPFFTTKPIGQGTGLGLSMVYGFVKQAGGHVRIHSQLESGTTVQLYLPRDLSTEQGGEAAPEATALPASAGETILVVEDEADVRSVIVEVLKELGYRYIEASDATAALAVIESKRRVDLLVTDVGLPGMNGRQLAEIACAQREGLKVLFVTGYAEQAASRNSFLSARMHLITKPFQIDLLANRIRDIIEAPVVSH